MKRLDLGAKVLLSLTLVVAIAGKVSERTTITSNNNNNSSSC